MAVTILTRRSDTPNKRPDPNVISEGELAVNIDAATGGLYYKDTDDNIVKVGSCQVSATAPNSTPAGSTGNSIGEFWFNTVANALFMWDGTSWVDVTTGVPGPVQSISGTSPIAIDNTDPQTPIVSVDAATTGALGVVQVGTNINVTSGTISVANSSTSAKGVVQLNDTTNNSSTDLALTAAQGKNLQDQIDALVVTSNLTFAGTFDTSVGPNGEMVTVSAAAAGLLNPFVVGDPLPTPAAENAEFFVIITTGGDYGPTTVPASAPPYHVGDWFLSDGVNWEFLNLGFQAPAATTTVEGVVYLATDLEVQTGTDTTNKAVNPASLQAKVSDSTSTTDSFSIASSTAVKSAYDLANAALPLAGGTMTGNIVLSSGVTIDYADTTAGSVAAADQLATVVDNSNGNLTIVPGFDAGTY